MQYQATPELVQLLSVLLLVQHNWVSLCHCQIENHRKMLSLQQAAIMVVLLRGVASQTQYGGNTVRVVPDPPIVESRAFPAPNVTLHSPSFAFNASFPQGWTEGTAGATSEYTLRKPGGTTDMVL